ncbi:cadmium-translocating P-type ATPase [Deferribacter autotrophicus]|uniref:P-type Zn(2+) transporter n=1 Tax=Deferribacter autotrophicus TaxID=500465 RepID=A0A5A8F7G7_9BACT|nr:heavy metal translocating P-type ATPase [Deferribacter autotrophicus]KAA0257796.1 cadmium-translocating P-type ATPase [Deferribacter autotrophicus]
MKKYFLKGLDCPACAIKIENGLKTALSDETISINFTYKTVTLKSEQYKDAKHIIKKLDPDVELIDLSKKEVDIDDSVNTKFEFTKILIALMLFTISLFYKSKLSAYPLFEYTAFLTPYFIIGYPVILKAAKNIKNKQIFDENFLILIATIGAIAIKELPEAVAVMLFYNVGEYLQNLAVGRSRKSIKNLLNLKPETVNIIKNDTYITVTPEEVKIGDIILVKPGEKIPLDGVVVEGSSFVNTSALTGEFVPKRVKAGEDILSGMINESGLLKIKVTKEYKDSTIAKILELVEEASSRKSKTEQFITKFARYYTPFVVFTALFIAFIPPIILPNQTYANWIYRALILLVISCPCALVISIPLSYFSGIGKSAKNGILVKGSNYLEALTDTEVVAFDKTGTLTKGVFKINRIVTKNGASEDEILKYAAYAEINSNHPVAEVIVKSFGQPIDKSKIESFEEIKGYGLKAVVNGKTILVGNDGLMHMKGIPHDDCDVEHSVVYVAVDGKFLGYILIDDEIKEESLQVVNKLKQVGVNKVIMLTGDNFNAAKKIADKLNIDEFYAGLLPQDKVDKLKEIKDKLSEKQRVVFAGDGINDAPVIALSDIGIAMGGVGSDAAIEAADIVIMDDNPLAIPKAIKIAKHTKKIAKENIIFSLSVKGIFIILGIFGVATMWEAVFADVGVALLAILNSLRIFTYKT